MVKSHIPVKMGLGFLATRRSSFLLWYPACQIRPLELTHQLRGHFQDRRVITQHLLPSSSLTVSEIQTREREDRIESDISRVTVSTTVDERSGRPDINQANKNPKKPIKMNPRGNRATRCLPTQVVQDLKSRMQEFRENLVVDEIPVHGDSHASSSHEESLEPTTKRREDLGKHSVKTHFPKDRNCEDL